MKKWILVVLLIATLTAIPLFAQEIVRIFDRHGEEVNPGMSERWPVSHLNGGVAGVKMLLSAPGNNQSHYVTGIILSGGKDPNGFYFLRQNCLFFDTTDTLTLTEHGADYDWGTAAAHGDFSCEFWMKLEATTAAVPNLVTWGDEDADGWNIELDTGSLITFTIHDGTHAAAAITGTTAIDDGEWHHIVCSVDRSSTTGMNLYVDSVMDATAAVSPAAVTDAMDGGTTIVLTGVASEKIYISTIGFYIGADAFLSATEVRTRYNGGIGMKYEGDETGLIVGYNTDEGVGTACHDIKNDASNVGGTSGTAWVPSRQNAATAEINEAGIPFTSLDMMRAVGEFRCAGTVTATAGMAFPTSLTFPHPIKIGRNCPMNILETTGGFDLIVFGYTGPN